MALASYGDLEAAIADWLARNSIANGRAADFIALLEARINRELRVPKMEKRAGATVTGGDPYVTLPDDIAQIRVLTIDDQIGGDLEFATAHWLRNTYRKQSGRPRHYAQFGIEWQLGPIPDANYTLEAIYYSKIVPLSDDTPVNWLLQEAPDLYLYGALEQAAIYYKNTNDVALYAPLAAAAMESLERSGESVAFNGPPLATRLV